MRWTVYLAIILSPAAVAAQTYTGPVDVIDGDTLVMTGERFRLFGIDAPEADQTCIRGDEIWECGKDATALLESLTRGKQIACEQVERDSYRRIIAICRSGRVDLAETMASTGMAISLPQFSSAYGPAEADAKARQTGVWGSTFELPENFRAARPEQFAQRARAEQPEAVAEAPRAFDQIYYRNCAAARAAGAAPLYRGQPGYRPQMDGDGDGIACEPYRRR
ncbi:excalibur calcium-binding domain-containing protein [Citromicrobium bathyomarinum]|uniref:excalibur calcium-binding domain-containing protein n=1 Tax=Citromicrobium bathyomarinum TaxID=72174 RepID=UPI00315A196A